MILRRLLAFLLLAGLAATARADQPDIAISARGVVRVALVATDGSNSYFVGHGSGIAVAPDKVLTNAHVVELSRTENNIVIGVIPAQGKKSFGGRVIAFSPRNDLALIQLEQGSLPVSTFYTGAVADGQHVTAIGYPGAVDRAQGLDLGQMISPISPVKSGGTVSEGRSAKQFDTILHTAPMAAGNSGGPLVDDCGRVLGINSFASDSQGTADAEFGFAVSNREIATFLREAGVDPRRTSAECKSMADYMEAERDRLANSNAADLARQGAAEARRAAALTRARDLAEQQIESDRENAMAIAALLLAVSVLGIGGAGLFATQKKQRRAIGFGIGGGLFLLLSGATFLLRPSYADLDARVKLPDGTTAAIGAKGLAPAGLQICTIDEGLSRITLSPTTETKIDWDARGCGDGRPFSGGGKDYARVAVAPGESVVAIDRFDPTTATWRSDRYSVSDETADKARALADSVKGQQCGAGPQALGALARAQDEVKALLPNWPTERLVYHCRSGKSENESQ